MRTTRVLMEVGALSSPSLHPSVGVGSPSSGGAGLDGGVHVAATGLEQSSTTKEGLTARGVGLPPEPP